ncbi:MAG TPA: TonB family protein [Casimicrobiaceae bacterium]|nr:TonB family protein [Casimicrobiaceae bacterium]
MSKGRPDLAIRIEPTISDRRGPPGSLITDLVVLTDSEDFQAALKQGVSTLQRVWSVPTTDQAAELLAAGRVGVLVIDTECVPRGAPEMITHLNLEFPDLVVVVAGTHAEVSQFARMVGEGLVYRFLQKPVSPARVRAFIDAAVRRHAELVAEAPAAVIARNRKPRGHARRYWMILFALAAITGGYKLWQRPGAAPPAITQAQSKPPPATPVPAAPSSAMTTPAPASDATVASAVPAPSTQTSQTVPDPAQHDADARDIAAIERAAAGQPSLRKAASPAPPARQSALPKFEAPPAVTSDEPVPTSAARPDAEVSQLVRNAQLALSAGNLIEPEAASAKTLLTNALKLDPQNALARQVYVELQTQVLVRAQTALKGPDPLTANRWISEAQNLGVKDAEIAPLRRSLENAQSSQRLDRSSGLARLAAQRLADDKLIEPAGDNARQYLTQLQTEDPALAAPLWQQLAERMLNKAKREAAQGRFDDADRWLKEADQTGVIGSDIASVRSQVQGARANSAFLTNLVPSSQLKTKKYVPPAYPSKALAAGVEGWVDLEFTVDATGAVKDITVRRAVPTGQFEKAAADALAKWRFQPVMRNGTAVEQRTGVRVQFKIER